MMKRDCPHCFERLEKRSFKKGLWSVDTDVCRSCNGLYLDKGELLKLTSNMGTSPTLCWRRYGASPIAPAPGAFRV